MYSKTIDKQKMATCHTKAVDHHLEAAKHYEADNHEKACAAALDQVHHFLKKRSPVAAAAAGVFR